MTALTRGLFISRAFSDRYSYWYLLQKYEITWVKVRKVKTLPLQDSLTKIPYSSTSMHSYFLCFYYFLSISQLLSLCQFSLTSPQPVYCQFFFAPPNFNPFISTFSRVFRLKILFPIVCSGTVACSTSTLLSKHKKPELNKKLLMVCVTS